MDMNFYCGAPYSFDYINSQVSIQNPSTMHSSNTALTWFFQRYLLQRAISVFKWTMPKTWEKNYALYCLYCFGFFAIVNTNKYGIIPQGCGLKGYTVMYAPRQAVISNPLLKGILEPIIGKECALIRLQPDYGGIWDLVSVYADYMSATAMTAGSNIIASKLAYVFTAKNKAFSTSYKDMADKVMSGEPLVVVDKNLVDENGNLNVQYFSNNLRSNYIASQLLQDLDEWERRFDTEIGIPRTNTAKKERLVSGEVNANLSQSYSRVDMWLESLQESCEIANSLFGDIIHVDWRINPHDIGGDNIGIQGSSTLNSRAV